LEGEKIVAKEREPFSKKEHLNFFKLVLNLEKFWPLFYPKSAEDYGREPVGESVPCAGV
jgi:hypothetical protein